MRVPQEIRDRAWLRMVADAPPKIREKCRRALHPLADRGVLSHLGTTIIRWTPIVLELRMTLRRPGRNYDYLPGIGKRLSLFRDLLHPPTMSLKRHQGTRDAPDYDPYDKPSVNDGGFGQL